MTRKQVGIIIVRACVRACVHVFHSMKTIDLNGLNQRWNKVVTIL